MTETVDPVDAPQLCAQHFPGGWPKIPAELVTVACEHGCWVREDATAPAPAGDAQR